jgi:hypothetical protein
VSGAEKANKNPIGTEEKKLEEMNHKDIVGKVETIKSFMG